MEDSDVIATFSDSTFVKNVYEENLDGNTCVREQGGTRGVLFYDPRGVVIFDLLPLTVNTHNSSRNNGSSSDWYLSLLSTLSFRCKRLRLLSTIGPS